MQTVDNALIELETKFWQSMVDEDTDTALALLAEPSLMVSSHGAMQFDHAQYREMAEEGSMVIKSFKLSDMEVMHPSDDTAVLTYRVKQTMAKRGDDEGIEEQEMADSSVWMLKDDEWLCVMHTETEVAPKAKAAKKTAKSKH